VSGENYWQRTLQHRLSRRGVLRAGSAGGVGLFGLAVAGCSSSTNNGGSNSTGNATAPATSATTARSTAAAGTAAAAQAGTPKPGGTLNHRLTGNTTLDPFHAATFRTAELSAYTYSRLLKIKTGPTIDVAYQYDPEPDLAQSVESPDLQTWTFKLRPGVTFHDVAPVSGRALDADDVVAT